MRHTSASYGELRLSESETTAKTIIGGSIAELAQNRRVVSEDRIDIPEVMPPADSVNLLIPKSKNLLCKPRFKSPGCVSLGIGPPFVTLFGMFWVFQRTETAIIALFGNPCTKCHEDNIPYGWNKRKGQPETAGNGIQALVMDQGWGQEPSPTLQTTIVMSSHWGAPRANSLVFV